MPQSDIFAPPGQSIWWLTKMKTVTASPVASGNAFELIKPECDDVVCINVEYSYPFAVANFYCKWHDLTDEEINDYLNSRI